MKITHVLLLSAFVTLFSCSCHVRSMAGDVGFGYTDDVDALGIQELMLSSVHVNHKIMTLQFEENFVTQTSEMKVKEMGPLGSGVVVRHRSGDTIIITAGHVCQTPEAYRNQETQQIALVIGDIFVITDARGGEHVAELIRFAESPDLCFLRVAGHIGSVVKLADHNPPVGAKVVNVGFPEGIRWDIGMHVSDGFVFGYDQAIEDVMMSSVPGIGGISGSGLFYNGRLVGIGTAVREKFHHSTYFVPISTVNEKLEEALGQ